MKGAALQRAIYSALDADISLQELVTGVYADVQQPNLPENDAEFPYVVIGADRLNRWDTKTNLGASADCQIDIWSRENNLIEAKEIGSAIYGALHYQPLTIVGADHVQTLCNSMSFTTDPDGQTKRGLILVNVIYDGI